MADRTLKPGDLDPRTLRWCAREALKIGNDWPTGAVWLKMLSDRLLYVARTEPDRQRKRRARRERDDGGAA